MKMEKSCGAVVYKIVDNKHLLYLVIKSKMGHHFTFPKGHVENDETEVETATREIKEETNLSVSIDTNFRMVITYSPRENVMKDVVYFVATPVDDSLVIPQETEVETARWVSFPVASKRITHENELNVLIKANEYLRNKNFKKKYRK